MAWLPDAYSQVHAQVQGPACIELGPQVGIFHSFNYFVVGLLCARPWTEPWEYSSEWAKALDCLCAVSEGDGGSIWGTDMVRHGQLATREDSSAKRNSSTQHTFIKYIYRLC